MFIILSYEHFAKTWKTETPSINESIFLQVINKSRRHMIHPWTRGADDTALEARVISNDFMFGSPASTRTFVSRWFSDLLIIWFLKHVKTLMLSLSMLHFSSHTAVTEVRMTHVWKLEWFHMISCSEPQNQGDSLIHLLMLIDQSILDMCIWMHLVSHLVLQVCILHLQVWLIMENLGKCRFHFICQNSARLHSKDIHSKIVHDSCQPKDIHSKDMCFICYVMSDTSRFHVNEWTWVLPVNSGVATLVLSLVVAGSLVARMWIHVVSQMTCMFFVLTWIESN